jgi:ferredoxin
MFRTSHEVNPMAERTLRIDQDRCQGHAVCYLLSSNLFDVDEQGRGSVIAAQVTPDRIDEALAAVDRCPEQAIQLG